MGLQISRFRLFSAIIMVIAVLALGTTESRGQTPIVQPGAPGEPSRSISAVEASDLASITFTEPDIRFMQGMISHHAQALEMTQLLADRSERDVMHRLAERIELSQEDEIMMMQDWLRVRSQEVTEPDAHHADGYMLMPGMLTEEEMGRLQQSEGIEFDREFLALMITHHEGALTMVEGLLSQAGAAQDSQLFAFTADITSDQSIEIGRMDSMLASLSTDPRVYLTAGFSDAGMASLNMELVTAVPKPEGFYDPRNPAGLRLPSEQDPVEESPEDNEQDESENETVPLRPGILNFANSDLAFAGDVVFEGNYHGFNAYNVEDPSSPRLITSVVCPGGQGDLSVIGDLLIMSVEQTRGRLDCGLQGVAEAVSDARFRGIRIFDISNAQVPRQVAAVQTCRGSHTHTLVTDPDDAGNIYVYGSGTSSIRPGEELEGCSDAPAVEDSNTALYRIDVIQVPLARPEEARIVSRPYVFADPDSGAIAGLWAGGDHGVGTQTTRETTQCHDITVYPELGLAAGACSGNGILFDISDPTDPVRLHEVVDPGFAYWHSATFNNDGTKVIFTDEWGGGGRPRCRASDPREWGADAIFDIVDGKMEFRSYFKLPAPQTEQENCVAHNGSLVPVPGRDIFVQAWYQGGISVIDFTDSSNPVEIAYFDRGPIDGDELVMGGYWSSYWYKGFIYGTEIARGLDVLELLPSEYLTQNEILSASLVAPDVFNPQQQRRIDWPMQPVVARAYVEQLGRSDAIAADQAMALSDLLNRAESLLALAAIGTASDAAVAEELNNVATSLETDSERESGRTQSRLVALAEIMRGFSERLE
jgi:uncharacterized protein (DUF305 family)